MAFGRGGPAGMAADLQECLSLGFLLSKKIAAFVCPENTVLDSSFDCILASRRREFSRKIVHAANHRPSKVSTKGRLVDLWEIKNFI